MNTDEEILKVIDDAFARVQRPIHFTVEDGDPECMDHDQLLHSRTPDTLTEEDVGNPCYNPLTECLPEGLAHFFPALARFALNDHQDFEHPFLLALRLTSHGTANDFLEYCSASQRLAVHSLFCHILENRAELVAERGWDEDISECISLWDQSRK